jgi:hypothetical protein
MYFYSNFKITQKGFDWKCSNVFGKYYCSHLQNKYKIRESRSVISKQLKWWSGGLHAHFGETSYIDWEFLWLYCGPATQVIIPKIGHNNCLPHRFQLINPFRSNASRWRKFLFIAVPILISLFFYYCFFYLHLCLSPSPLPPSLCTPIISLILFVTILPLVFYC